MHNMHNFVGPFVGPTLARKLVAQLLCHSSSPAGSSQYYGQVAHQEGTVITSGDADRSNVAFGARSSCEDRTHSFVDSDMDEAHVVDQQTLITASSSEPVTATPHVFVLSRSIGMKKHRR